MWRLVLILAALGFSYMMFYLSVKLPEKDTPLKILFLLSGLFGVSNAIEIARKIAEDETQTELASLIGGLGQANIWIIVVTIAYMLIWFIYDGLDSMRRNWDKKNKAKTEGF